jgi:hypothetical protein
MAHIRDRGYAKPVSLPEEDTSEPDEELGLFEQELQNYVKASYQTDDRQGSDSADLKGTPQPMSGCCESDDHSSEGDASNLEYEVDVDYLAIDFDRSAAVGNFRELFDDLCRTVGVHQVESLGQSEYPFFLNTYYWHIISGFLKESSDYCQCCSSKRNLQVHHRSYCHRGREHENLQDLSVLCSDCHDKSHKK